MKNSKQFAEKIHGETWNQLALQFDTNSILSSAIFPDKQQNNFNCIGFFRINTFWIDTK